MRKTLLGISLPFALGFPALAQDKEQDRVENAGKVMQEILDAPDSIPKSVLDKAERSHSEVLKFSFGLGGRYGRGVMTCPPRHRREQEPLWQRSKREGHRLQSGRAHTSLRQGPARHTGKSLPGRQE